MGNKFDIFKKEVNKASEKAGIPTKNPPPEWFIDTGNYLLNKIVSGKYQRGWAQGRIGALAGPSGAGKSFLLGNAIKAAQEQGCVILILDSENALDEDYLTAIGVDVNADSFFYRDIKTIQQATSEISNFTKAYRSHGLDDKVFIALDSLDMLMTEANVANYEKGETKGDQGQQAKQLKDFLKTMVQDLKQLPFVMVCTKQVYKEQDKIAALSMPYVFTDSIRFAFSQIFMVTKLMLKTDDVEKKSKAEKAKEKYAGIWLKAMGFKTRFTKPFQQVKISVPWDEGMDRFSGLLEAAAAVGVVEKNGGWYTYGEKKFQASSFATYQDEILKILIDRDDATIDVDIEEDDAPADVKDIKKEKIKLALEKGLKKLSAEPESEEEDE
jgi:recombination protein RecA